MLSFFVHKTSLVGNTTNWRIIESSFIRHKLGGQHKIHKIWRCFVSIIIHQILLKISRSLLFVLTSYDWTYTHIMMGLAMRIKFKEVREFGRLFHQTLLSFFFHFQPTLCTSTKIAQIISHIFYESRPLEFSYMQVDFHIKARLVNKNISMQHKFCQVRFSSGQFLSRSW